MPEPTESRAQALRPEAIAGAFRLTDLAWTGDGQALIWCEGRSGRTTLVSWSRQGRFRRDLVREPDVQARVGYGGGEFAVGGSRIYYVSGRRLYSIGLEPGEPTLVTEADCNLCSPTVSPDGRWILLIGGDDTRDRVLIAAANGGSPVELFGESDFAMQPCWHPGGQRVGWISWDHPFMPWQRTRLIVADLDFGESLPRLSTRHVVESASGRPCAWFQPSFSLDGSRLAAVNDDSGWSNLVVYNDSDLCPLRRYEDEAEYAPPAWVQGLRSYCWIDGDHLLISRNHQGMMSLAQVSLFDGRREPPAEGLDDYTWFSQPASSPGGATAVLAASAQRPPCILILHGGRSEVVHRALPESRILRSFSKPRPVRWEAGEHSGHGLYYPPVESSAKPSPAVIKIHGGPTSQSQADFDFDVQFFTTRGFAFLKLNYRGSSGYGRAFREALDGGWGERDVEDVGLAARVLVEHLGADPKRLILSGGSAGGFTLLLALIRFPNRFRAGVCRFPVTDLTALTAETHRFERHYVDSLIGPLPESAEIYRERSPLLHASRIRTPLALFQGDCDKVVPRDQSDRLAEALREEGIPILYRVFPGEGHGWRKSETITEYYRLVEKFLREIEI